MFHLVTEMFALLMRINLANLLLEPVDWDEKHVDCFQFRAARGRWEAVFVFKASGSATLVGPYKRGAPEKPCAT